VVVVDFSRECPELKADTALTKHDVGCML